MWKPWERTCVSALAQGWSPSGSAFFRGSCHAAVWDSRAARRSLGLAVHQIPPPPVDSYEYGFDRAQFPRLVLDLRQPVPDPRAADWLRGPRRLRGIGNAYDPAEPDRFFLPVSLPAAFDAVVYLADTSPSRLRPFQ